MKIYINAAHTPHSPGAVWRGRTEHSDVLLFSGELSEKLGKAGFENELFAGYKKPADIKEEDVVLIFHRGTAFKDGISGGAMVTVTENASAAVQYEAYALLDAVCISGKFRYRGVHTVTPSYPHRFIEKTGSPHTFLFDLGFIESDEDNRLFDSRKEKITDSLVNKLTEIYKEGKYEDNT